MSLENLLKINKLQTHNPSREAVQRLLHAAARNITDAGINEVSGETRFDAAYKCIMQCAMVALWANGYRTSTRQPVHHQVAIQTLPITIGLEQDRVIVLDALRKQRNINDYRATPLANRRSSSALNKRSNFIRLSAPGLQSIGLIWHERKADRHPRYGGSSGKPWWL